MNSLGALSEGARTLWHYRLGWGKAVMLPLLAYVVFRQSVMPVRSGFDYFGNIFVPSLLVLQPHLSVYRLFLGQEREVPWIRVDWKRQTRFLAVYCLIAAFVFLIGFFVFATFGLGPEKRTDAEAKFVVSCIWFFAFLFSVLQFPSLACDGVDPTNFPWRNFSRLLPILALLFALNFIIPMLISDYTAVTKSSNTERAMRVLADLVFWITFVYQLAVISVLYRAGLTVDQPVTPLLENR